MKLLITGSNGQVGWELARTCAPLGEVVALDRAALDLARPESIQEAIRRHRPDVVLNAGAYTAVDAAEDDESTAMLINGTAVGVIADEAARLGALVVHYSTDYVFEGTGTKPYVETDPTHPLSAYGRSKLAGEHALARSHAAWLCLRTSWVYAPRGKNFVRTIVRLAAEREELRIVADQVGAPTSAKQIAEATRLAVEAAVQERREGRFVPALLHLTATGETSWYGFASAIVEQLRQHVGPPRVQRVVPITTEEYPVRAVRPRNSRLDGSALARRFGIQVGSWQAGLAECLDRMAG